MKRYAKFMIFESALFMVLAYQSNIADKMFWLTTIPITSTFFYFLLRGLPKRNCLKIGLCSLTEGVGWGTFALPFFEIECPLIYERIFCIGLLFFYSGHLFCKR